MTNLADAILYTAAYVAKNTDLNSFGCGWPMSRRQFFYWFRHGI